LGFLADFHSKIKKMSYWLVKKSRFSANILTLHYIKKVKIVIGH